ncbi:MAG TPA: hypothetical protein VNZ57_05325 [Longimicrobiales bacterium]|nr:hypothetical protein [Longimicrobiales bacterium]
MDYAHRLHALKPRRMCRLTDHSIEWRDDGGGSDEIPYSDIHRVRARYAPTRVQRQRYLLELMARSGRSITISNTSYRGIGDFEQDDAGYVAFTRSLHERLARANPEVEYRSGTTALGYAMSWVIAAYLLVVVAAVAAFLIATGLILIVAVKLAVIVYFAPTMVRYIRSVRPRRYQPDAIPAGALPPVNAAAGSLDASAGGADA